jgi:hypothetical protein
MTVSIAVYSLLLFILISIVFGTAFQLLGEAFAGHFDPVRIRRRLKVLPRALSLRRKTRVKLTPFHT